MSKKTLLGGFWSPYGFQLFIGKLSILADHLPIAWKKFKCTTSIKVSTGNILRDEKKILLRWRKYFEDLLNPVRVTPTDTCDTIDFGKEEVFTLTKKAAAIRGLKSGKAAGEDKIRSEMLKALNGEGIHRLTRVC